MYNNGLGVTQNYGKFLCKPDGAAERGVCCELLSANFSC